MAEGQRVFIVEGEIAAGKTELIKALATNLRARGLRVCTVFEPVEKWNAIGILQDFYRDSVRHGYSFQTYVFATRVIAIAAAMEKEPAADLYILERSPATDQIFMELQRAVLTETEMEMYAAWCSAYTKMLPMDLSQSKVLYLKTSLGKCMERLMVRHRAGEIVDEAQTGVQQSKPSGVSVEYQKRLRRAHEQFFQGITGADNEFPRMPASPFPTESVIEVPPEIADANFKDPGPEQVATVKAITQLMGYE
jgi:deoxyadenosine/deoxycytidine kinase